MNPDNFDEILGMEDEDLEMEDQPATKQEETQTEPSLAEQIASLKAELESLKAPAYEQGRPSGQPTSAFKTAMAEAKQMGLADDDLSEYVVERVAALSSEIAVRQAMETFNPILTQSYATRADARFNPLPPNVAQIAKNEYQTLVGEVLASTGYRPLDERVEGILADAAIGKAVQKAQAQAAPPPAATNFPLTGAPVSATMQGMDAADLAFISNLNQIRASRGQKPLGAREIAALKEEGALG